MGKKVTVISTSLRHGSNSAVLADAFAMGASEAGNEVTLISLTFLHRLPCLPEDGKVRHP